MDKYDKLRRSMIRTVSLDESLVCDQQEEQLSKEEQQAADDDFMAEMAPKRNASAVGTNLSTPCPGCNQPLTLKPTQVCCQMPSSVCRMYVCVEIHMCMYYMCVHTCIICAYKHIMDVLYVYLYCIGTMCMSNCHSYMYLSIHLSIEYVHLYHVCCLSLSLGRVTPDDDCVFSQEKFGCPQCKGIFHAGTQQKIGELTTDESGNQKPVLYGKSAHQVATNRMRV